MFWHVYRTLPIYVVAFALLGQGLDSNATLGNVINSECCRGTNRCRSGAPGSSNLCSSCVPLVVHWAARVRCMRGSSGIFLAIIVTCIE